MVLNENAEAIAFATLLPGAASVVGYGIFFSKGSAVRTMWQTARKPAWFPQNDAVMVCVDMATTVPLVYAAYNVYKLGGFHSSDTRSAVSAYAATFVGATVIGVPAILSRKWSKMFWCTATLNFMQLVTAVLMYNVQPRYGLLCVPAVIWGHVGVVLMRSMCELNES